MKKNRHEEEGRRVFSECLEENPKEEDPLSRRRFCVHSISPLTPSYHYHNIVQERIQANYPEISIRMRRPGMRKPERDAFFAAFASEHDVTRVGFAVMGAVFGEGIDLVGVSLIGTVIVGVGMPQLCVELDLIRDYFQARSRPGFDYAYTFPGMNRVLQAVGHVIRSETGSGVVPLIDTRFAELRYRRLFPAWWHTLLAGSVEEIRATISSFWEPAAEKRQLDESSGAEMRSEPRIEK